MTLRWLVLGHLRGLLERWTRTLLLVVAVGAGVSLVVGVTVAKTSLDASMSRFTQGVIGNAALRVEGPVDHGGLDQSVVAKVAATPGVQAAVPLVVSIVEATDSAGKRLLVPALGVDCSVQALIGGFECNPEALRALGDAPVVGPALQKRLGPRGSLHTNLTSIPTTTLFAVDGLSQLNKGLVAIFELSASQRQLTRPNGLDQILVIPNRGVNVDELRIALGGVVGEQNRVLRADAPLGSSIVAMILLPFLFLISLLGLVIGAQVVRNTVDLSLEERRREIATSAALGATPRRVLVGLLSEGAVIGVLGGVVGLVMGTFVARAFVNALSVELAKATGLKMGLSTPGSVVVLALVGGIALSVLSSVAPARRAAKLDLVAELSDRRKFETTKDGSRRALAITGALLVGGLVLGWLGHRNGSMQSWQPNATIAALVGCAIASGIACAQLSPRLLALLQRAPGFTTGPTRIALTNLVRARRRVVAVTVAVMAPVFVTTVFGGVVPGMKTGSEQYSSYSSAGRVWVSTLSSNNTSGIDSKITPDLIERLRALPGVAGVQAQYFGGYDAQLFSVNAFDGTPPDYPVFVGKRGADALAAGEVMLGPAMARRHHVGPGDTITIPARFGGTATFTVGGVWKSTESVGYSVTMRADQFFAIDGPRPAGSVLLLPDEGVTPAALAASVRAAHLDPRLRVYDPDQLAREFTRDIRSLTTPIEALQRAMVIVAMIATASTLVLAAAQRRRDSAVLAALGMSPRDLAKAATIETLITVGAATLVAAACAQFTLLAFTWASANVTGLDIPYRLAASPIAVAAGVSMAIALVGSILPAWRTARTNVMTALRAA